MPLLYFVADTLFHLALSFHDDCTISIAKSGDFTPNAGVGSFSSSLRHQLDSRISSVRAAPYLHIGRPAARQNATLVVNKYKNAADAIRVPVEMVTSQSKPPAAGPTLRLHIAYTRVRLSVCVGVCARAFMYISFK